MQENGPEGRQALIDAVSAEALGDLSNGNNAKGSALLGQIVDDWLLEAGDDRHREEILSASKQEFVAKLAGLDAQARLALMARMVLERRLNRLSVRSFALGKSIVDGTVIEAEAKASGHELMKEIQLLSPQVKALGEPSLTRTLSEVSMEALYAIERKAMSLRLGRYQASKGGGGAPDLR